MELKFDLSPLKHSVCPTWLLLFACLFFPKAGGSIRISEEASGSYTLSLQPKQKRGRSRVRPPAWDKVGMAALLPAQLLQMERTQVH